MRIMEKIKLIISSLEFRTKKSEKSIPLIILAKEEQE
jgi:hypothetical protein